MLKTLFFGTPATAVPFLEKLVQKSHVLGVVTSPDKPAGRGYDISMPEVKKAALSLGLPVMQPASLRKDPVLDQLKKWGPADLGVVVAYGKLIPPEIFNYPRCGLMNVHFSLLPKYRGAGPVQWALIRGETQTGVSLFQIEEGLDSGPVYLQRPEPILPDDNSLTLRERLAGIGAALLERILDDFSRGVVKAVPQEGNSSQAPLLKKEDGRIAWNRLSAAEAANLARGAYEWPGAFCHWKGKPLKITAAETRPWRDGEDPGRVVAVERGKGFLIKCKKDALLALHVKPEGRKEMDAWSFANGARLQVGDVFE